MIILHNGCRISEMTVNPKNWLTQGAAVKKDWYVQYYFHDPVYKDHPQLKYGKLRIIKGMNDTVHLGERKAITKAIMADEHNPIKDISKMPIGIKIRETLSEEQSEQIEIKYFIFHSLISISPILLISVTSNSHPSKPTGQGTGLGLSLTYDIIKAHGWEIKVATKEGGGAGFIIELPIR